MTKQRLLIILSAVFIIAVAVIAVVINMNLHSTMRTMKFIEGRYRGSYFVDHDQTICVESSKDIGWYRRGTSWCIKFGKLELEFTKNMLRDQKVLHQLKCIGMDVRGNLEENDLRWYWQNEQIEEWVPS